MATYAERGVPLSTLCPKFLHTNSTSHTWPFSAIAELIDNAYDPDVSAKQFWIDKTVFQGQECLIFMDNGNGLDLETMHKMLSFGYSDKTASKGVQPIGMYGNGFKSGAMRLGRDAIVFSKSKSSSCVGMLSQTYLREISAEQIIVPIVCFQQGKAKEFSVREEHKASLQDILHYSPFKTENELLVEVDAISPHWSSGKTGTRIIIWNLRSTSTRTTEFDFETDRYDIRIPLDVCEEMSDLSEHPGVKSYIPESVNSLRAYCSILYLKPRMQIIIRGQRVKSQLIAKSLAFVRKDYYNPTFQTKSIPMTFGYNTKSKDQYGVMMYHKNRLIKAYEHVGCQLKTNYKGVGVIGVIECNFLDPTHNKQSFSETDKYRKTMHNLGIKLDDYWKEIQFRRKQEDPNNSIPVEDTMKRPDQNWVQCEECSRWRKLPDGIDCSKLPDTWCCRMNPDPQFRNCQVEEEPEDSDDDQVSYCKTFKRQEREDKKNKMAQRQKEAEDRRRQEEQHLANLARENRALKQQHARLKRQLHQATPPSPPTTPRSGGRGAAASSSTLSQAACSPSSDTSLPVISDIWSTNPLTGKRTQPVTPRGTPKRPRINGIPETSTSADMCPQSSPSVPANNDNAGTEDDIVILERYSTPKPKKPDFDLTKVKTEEELSDANVGMLLDCTSDAALDVASVTDAAGKGSAGSAAVGSSSCPVFPPEVANSTTQTEVTKVKKEGEGSEEEERAGQSTSNENSGVDIDVCNGVTCHLDNEDAGPSCAEACDKTSSALHYPSMTDAQEQQDQLLELMQATAHERDSFKEQVHQLSCQLQDTQSRLQELSLINVKRECSHRGSQTEETGGRKEYKSLLESIKQKLRESMEDKEGLLAATEASSSTAQGEEQDMAEIALNVDRLLQELDQKNKVEDELRSQHCVLRHQLDSLEDERANLAAQCEGLRSSLQQQREKAQEGSTAPHTATNSCANTDPGKAGGTADSVSDSSSDTSRSLIELRHNIGRLLVSFVPALDLGQVNYECNVIDEILEQVLSSVDSITLQGLIDSKK